MSHTITSRPRRAIVACALVAGALSATPSAPAAAATPGWTQPGYGAGNTFYNPSESVINAATIDDVELRWKTDLPTTEDWSCSGPSEPLVSGGRVFVTDETGIGAYAEKTGLPLWHHTFSWPDDESTPHLAVAGGLLVAGNTGCQSASDPNGGIIALTAATGRLKWSVGAGGPVESLVVDKNVVVVSGSSENSAPAVRAFRLSDGKDAWTVPGYWSAGVAAAGRLLVSRADGTGVAALAITTGKKLWAKPGKWGARAANPAGDAFYLSDADGGLSALKAASGAALWTTTSSGGPIAADGKRVYRTVFHGIEARDAKSGKRLWVASFGTATGQPVRAGGLLYTDVDGGSLGILSAATGKVASSGWQFGGYGDVVVADGRLYRLDGATLQAYAP